MTNLADLIWARAIANEGAWFETKTGKRFKYEVESRGIRPCPGGRPTNRRITRKQFDEAVSRCPLHETIDLQDLIGPSYLFGMLMDRRIRQNAW
jgi:hypothetical protein